MNSGMYQPPGHIESIDGVGASERRKTERKYTEGFNIKHSTSNDDFEVENSLNDGPFNGIETRVMTDSEIEGIRVYQENLLKDIVNPLIRSKYDRKIRDTYVDVYEVLVAFNVTCPAIAHGIKKLLAPGQRGSKSLMQDLKEARDSINRAIDLENNKYE